MLFPPRHQATPRTVPPSPALRLRWLAAPLAAVLLAPAALVLAPSPALAASSGKLTLTSTSTVVKTIAGARSGSRTAVTLKVPSARPFYAAVQLRSTGTTSGYRAMVEVGPDGVLSVALTRVDKGVETVLGPIRGTGIMVKTGSKVRLEGGIAGTDPVRLYVRAWKAGRSAPRWQYAALDTSAGRITGSAQTRLWARLPGATKRTTVAFSTVRTSALSVGYAARFAVEAWASTTPPAYTPAGGKPSASTTGVRPGSTLKRHNGNITVTTNGAVLSNLDIHGFVSIKAKNVTITNSIVRGGKSKRNPIGLITNYGNPGLLISDVRIVPEYPSVYFDGIKGSEFTARRVHISGNVDSVKIHGNNVTIENSLLENTTHYASDPQQGGGPTHNDNVQILNGANLRITGNTIRGAQNFAVLGGATKGTINLVLANNWLDGGHCTVKLSVATRTTQTATVTGNKFGPNRKVSNCAFTAYPKVRLTQRDNTSETTGSSVTPLITVS